MYIRLSYISAILLNTSFGTSSGRGIELRAILEPIRTYFQITRLKTEKEVPLYVPLIR